MCWICDFLAGAGVDEAASTIDAAGRAFLSVDLVLMQCLFTFSLNLLSIFFLCFVRGCYCCIKFICVSSDCSLLGTLTLPESSNLLSVFMFAECISSDTRRTSCLPSASLNTLGKFLFCRVSTKKHSAKRWFVEC